MHSFSIAAAFRRSNLLCTLFPPLVFTLLVVLFGGGTLTAQPHIETQDIATGLKVPVQMQWGGDQHLWVAERAGRVLRIDPETGEQQEVLQLTDVFAPDVRGIFGMVIGPDFPSSSYLFIYYSYQNVYPQGWDLWGKVVRYSYDTMQKKLVDPLIILDSIQTVQWNYGGGMVALPDQTLLIATGDGVDYYLEAQSHTSDRGKILRVGFDGSIPSDNPWKDYPRPLNTLWTTGFHNPLGLTRGPSGLIYATDWGTSSLDEINIIEGGRNYGWPFVIGRCDGHPISDEVQRCADSNMVEPIYEWYKAEGKVAGVSDVSYYAGEGIKHWHGSLLVATLLDGLHQLKLSEDGRQVEQVAVYLSPSVDSTSPGRMRTLCTTPEGRIFVGTSNDDGEGGPGASDDKIFEVLDAAEVKDTVERTPLQVRSVITGLHVPWDIQWGYDNWLWITERNGRVGRVDPETGDYQNLATLSNVAEQGNTGLLGLALHPNFCDSPYVFLVYCYARADNPALRWERLVRFTYKESLGTLVDEVVLVDSIDVSASHAGSRLVISRDRKIFMTVSDGDQTQRAQDLTSKIGKILRLNLDGSIPKDNPWADQPWPACLIWSMGHRNPQGLIMGANGFLYSSEHGPWSDDEINIIEKGKNYGWPDVMGFCDTEPEKQFCADSAVTEPIIAWSPTIAPSGIVYYGADAIPEWKGSLLVGLLKNNRLVQLKLSEDGRGIDTTIDYFVYEFGRIRGVCVAPDGRVFFTVTNFDGVGVPHEGDDRIIEVRSALGHPPLPEPGELCDSIADVDTVHMGVTTWLQLASDQVFVFPQPLRDESVIELGREFGKGQIRVFDLGGTIVRSEPFQGGHVLRLVRNGMLPGLYLMEVSDSTRVVHLRVMVE